MPPIPLGNIGFDAQIQAAVNRKLEELKAMEKGAPTGRLLEFEGLEEEQGQKVLEQGLIEIANYVGLHFLLFSLLGAVGLKDPMAAMVVVRLLHALWSLVVVRTGYRIALRLGNEEIAWRTGLFLALFGLLLPALGCGAFL